MKKILIAASLLLVSIMVPSIVPSIASARAVFGFGLTVPQGPPVVSAPPPAYSPYPYGYYGLGPGYYGPGYYGYRVWVPGYWDRVWTYRGWARVWRPGHWEYRR